MISEAWVGTVYHVSITCLSEHCNPTPWVVHAILTHLNGCKFQYGQTEIKEAKYYIYWIYTAIRWHIKSTSIVKQVTIVGDVDKLMHSLFLLNFPKSQY